MSNTVPVAIINGIDRLGAKKLAELLVENNIKVIGVGEYVGGLEELNNFEYRTELEEVEESGEYWFDFEESVEAWERAENDKAKLTILGVNRVISGDKIPSDFKANWRIINFHGVYGRGMENEKEVTEETGYLIEALKLAVANKNLVLPSRQIRLRLMSDKEVTEVAMRGSFLSGTEREVFEVWGGLTNSEELAKILIEDAKMTRFKVIESNEVVVIPDDSGVEEVHKRLRWQPSENLREGLGETLQGYFVKADEESRFKKTQNPVVESLKLKITEDLTKEDKNPSKRFEVMVEEEIDKIIPKGDFQKGANDKLSPKGTSKRARITNEKKEVEKTQEEKPKEEVLEIAEELKVEEDIKEVAEEERKQDVEREEMVEIKPIIVKNSNNRPNFRHLGPERDEPELPQKKIDDIIKVEKVEFKENNKQKIIGFVKNYLKHNRNYGKWGWRVLGGVGVLLISLMLMWVGTNYWMYKNTVKIKTLIEEKKYDEATLTVQKIKAQVNKEEINLQYWGMNGWVWGRRYQNVLKAWEEGLVVGENVIELSRRMELVNEAVFKDKQINWTDQLTNIKKDMAESKESLGLLQARLSGDWSWVPARWKGDLGEAKKQIAEAKTMMITGEQVVNILPELVGLDGKRREYMVLFQNETELRPGGGFIGSYALMTFQGGKLLNFEIKDVYEADGQLIGHVEPPEPIKNYLGEAKWFMRDANWQADFRLASRDIQWFLEKETGRKVDGVIGVDLAVVRGILGVTGEIYITDFKEKINKNNLYEQAEFYSETKFFPGSNQKASFLGGLGKQLFEEIKNLKGEKRLALAQTIFDLFEKNEIQMQLNNKEAAEIVANLGWNGAIYEGKCGNVNEAQGGQPNCFADYLYLVEANVGVNKANYFLYRNIEQTVDIGNQSVGRVVKINYENTAKNSNWPGGDYKNYMRVYIPESANLAEVSATTPTVLQSGGIKTIYSEDSLKVNTVKGKKEVGFLVTVPVAKKVTVEIRYNYQIDLNGKDRFSYLYYIQRQSGFGDTGLVTLVSIPDGWQPTQVEPTASVVNGKLLFNQKLEKDIKMGVEIGK